MDGVQVVEGNLNAVVKEYLQMLDYAKSVREFEDEVGKKGKQIELDSLPPSQDENQLHIQNKIMQAFDHGNNQVFIRLWSENIPQELQDDTACKRLEFNTQLYFAIFHIKQGSSDQNKIDKGMRTFKTFLETRGAALSQTTEFVTFYALPFVPASSLKNHPSFSILFQESWTAELRQKLEDFLSTVLYAAPLPYLYKLFTASGDRSVTEKTQYENHIQALQQQISEHEYRATLYFKRYTKIQGDYKNLINIAAELVDSLESAVRGKMVTPEYLRSICERLFNNAQNPIQSTDFTRPGTAGSLLRASVANAKPGVAIGNDVPYLPSLNYIKIKDDLRRQSPRKKALLLQALRMRLARSQVGEQRDAVVSGYIANDILGCASDIKQGETMVNLLNSSDELIQSQTAMLFNTLASFTAGRVYIGQSEVMMKQLLSCLKRESERTKTGENILGAMQKLSLRRQVQSTMIDYGLVAWLIKTLEEPELLNDYSLEYSVALLMNLCLRSAGKKQCLDDCEAVLQLLADLLDHENKEIQPYVNGTLYSILALPTIRQRAVSMGLEEILRCYVQDDDPDMNRQIKFIIKQMNTVDKSATDDPQSDNEEEDEDDDEEGDVLDAELDEEEVQIAKLGELFGEQLLSAQYLGVLSSISVSTNFDSKALGDVSPFTQEKPLTRPVTPRGHSKLTAIEELSSRSSVRADLNSRSGRPKTQSSGSAARRNERTPVPEPNQEMPPPRSRPTSRPTKLDPFQTKTKIPRTPDTAGSNRSRPLTGDVPLPTRSVSPPVPKPSSRGQVRCFQDCLKPCRNMKKRHFHCKICDYISERLDNMKRHIPYHFLKTKKERQRAPDGIKMVCHEYFTEECHVDDCSYREKNYPHFHCKICKSWACNHKKSYKYRLKHLNRSHYLFFMEKDNCKETSNDSAIDRKIKMLKQPDLAKILTFPPAEEQVLNARRRAKSNAKKLDAFQYSNSGKFEDAESKVLTMDYLENAGNDVKNIMQAIGSADEKVSIGNADDHRGNFERRPNGGNLKSQLNKKHVKFGTQPMLASEASTYSVTLNGDLGTILQIILSLKKSGIVPEDPSFQNIIRKHPDGILQQLNLLVKNNNCQEAFCSKMDQITESTEVENLSDNLSDDGFSETVELASFDAGNPLQMLADNIGVFKNKSFPVIEPHNILEFLSKIIVDDAVEVPEDHDVPLMNSNSNIESAIDEHLEKDDIGNTAIRDGFAIAESNIIKANDQDIPKSGSVESSSPTKKHKYQTRSSRPLTQKGDSLRHAKRKHSSITASKKIKGKGSWNKTARILAESTEIVDSSNNC
ncbi:lisH domain-containing protein ARMC9-like isoform X2 [Rhopilema esculentum]|uniref:lisH domain-containing protein ARMC9-like isoform X2 n=1 Tax=Rhopilema esculentum TaxID=499914 RepID=UPI0031E05178